MGAALCTPYYDIDHKPRVNLLTVREKWAKG
jgi:hypothetical protein